MALTVIMYLHGDSLWGYKSVITPTLKNSRVLLHSHLSRQSIAFCKQICDKMITTLTIISNTQLKPWQILWAISNLLLLKHDTSFPFFLFLFMKH